MRRKTHQAVRWREKGATLSLALLAGCSTAPLAPPQMSSDWKIHQGQAVWQPKPGARIAGELLVATNSAGNFIVEFSKPPITIATAQRDGARWQFEFPAEKKSYRGQGRGPSRVIWLHLAPALAGRDSTWRVSITNENWRIENKRGETLEGYLSP